MLDTKISDGDKKLAVQQEDRIDRTARLSELEAQFDLLRQHADDDPPDGETVAIINRISEKLSQAEVAISEVDARISRRADRSKQIAEMQRRAAAVVARIAARRRT